MALIEWSQKYSVGDTRIDGEHQRLIGLINQLYSSMLEGIRPADLRRTFEELVAYTQYHFQHEERLLEEHQYPDRDRHKEEHRRLIHRVQELDASFQQEQDALSVDVMDFLKTWLTDHILRSDLSYSPHLFPKSASVLQEPALQPSVTAQDAEQRKLFSALEKKTRETDAIFKATSDIYLRLDRQGVILSFHAGEKSMLPGRAGPIPDFAVQGKSISDLFAAPLSAQLEDAIGETLKNHRGMTLEFSASDDSRHEFRLAPLFSSEVVLVIRDISEKFAAQRAVEFERAKSISGAKMAELGEMAAGIAHEINNPLAVIFARTSQARNALRKTGNTEPALLKAIEQIDETAHRISRIVRGLRSFARKSDGDPFTLTPLQMMIEDTLELCGSKLKSHGVALRLSDAPDVSIDCHPSEIVQVLLNLINNAVDAQSELTQDKWIAIDVVQGLETVTITVSDNGPGIPEAIRAKIMQPFFTTKEVGKGTGLGLSISKGLIESHKGTLTLDAASPKTRFVITLPKKQAT